VTIDVSAAPMAKKLQKFVNYGHRRSSLRKD
jgi:hypothetical protein